MTTTHNVKKLAGKAVLSGGVALVALGTGFGHRARLQPAAGAAGQADRRWHARSANTLDSSTEEPVTGASDGRELVVCTTG
jgi:hypothetical protein